MIDPVTSHSEVCQGDVKSPQTEERAFFHVFIYLMWDMFFYGYNVGLSENRVP